MLVYIFHKLKIRIKINLICIFDLTLSGNFCLYNIHNFKTIGISNSIQYLNLLTITTCKYIKNIIKKTNVLDILKVYYCIFISYFSPKVIKISFKTNVISSKNWIKIRPWLFPIFLNINLIIIKIIKTLKCSYFYDWIICTYKLYYFGL